MDAQERSAEGKAIALACAGVLDTGITQEQISEILDIIDGVKRKPATKITPDQQIRMTALNCATVGHKGGLDFKFWNRVDQFETYLRDGKLPGLVRIAKLNRITYYGKEE